MSKENEVPANDINDEALNEKVAGNPLDTRFEGYTPVMRQYLQMCADNADALVLYRLGDFYECFFDAAVKLNRLIGLTLTHRGKDPKGNPIAMAGIPASTLEQYLARLVKLGLSVAICEQIGDPAAARTGMMERKIVRIVTPGTITDGALLSEKSDSTLAAWVPATRKSEKCALVWLTLTNGDFRAVELATGDLTAELSRIAPSEVLVNERGHDQVHETGYATAVTELPDWHFDGERGEELIKKRFGLNNLDAWGLTDSRQILAGINAILGYVEQTQKDALPYIRPLVLESESSYVGLDASTRRNLEITETLRGDDGSTLFGVLDICRTGMGSRMLKHWLHHPLRDFAMVSARHEAVEEVMGELPHDPFCDLLVEVPDIERTAGRIALKSIRPKEAAGLRDALPRLAALADAADRLKSPLFKEAARHLRVDPALWERLSKTLLEEPATLLRDGDVIASSASPELAELRNLRDNAGEYLTELEAREKERTGIATLRVQYNRLSGYTIDVPRGQADKVPVEYRRRQTLKNVERYITPELKEYEDKVLSAKERASQIEKGIWDELVVFMAGFIEPLMRASAAVATLDVIDAFARHAFEARWCRPELTQAPGIEITAGRHPVVEHTLEQYVPNNCRLVPGRRLMVITGPNMGGKSTFMRSVALIVLLAFAGSFVPAQAVRLGSVDKILTRIGASDDLARGRSTFMVEMTEAAGILHQATDQSLVLMDEIGRGTATFDGLSLAAAIGHELADVTRSWTLFATHYFELTQLSSQCKEVVNVHVSAEQTKNGIVFMHDVREGPASQSFGIAVAGLAGVPARVIRRAKATLTELENNAHVTGGAQQDLFAGLSPAVDETPEDIVEIDPDKEKKDALISLIADTDVDNLSAREALALIYDLHEKAKKLS